MSDVYRIADVPKGNTAMSLDKLYVDIYGLVNAIGSVPSDNPSAIDVNVSISSHDAVKFTALVTRSYGQVAIEHASSPSLALEALRDKLKIFLAAKLDKAASLAK